MSNVKVLAMQPAGWPNMTHYIDSYVTHIDQELFSHSPKSSSI